MQGTVAEPGIIPRTVQVRMALFHFLLAFPEGVVLAGPFRQKQPILTIPNLILHVLYGALQGRAV